MIFFFFLLFYPVWPDQSRTILHIQGVIKYFSSKLELYISSNSLLNCFALRCIACGQCFSLRLLLMKINLKNFTKTLDTINLFNSNICIDLNISDPIFFFFWMDLRVKSIYQNRLNNFSEENRKMHRKMIMKNILMNITNCWWIVERVKIK